MRNRSIDLGPALRPRRVVVRALAQDDPLMLRIFARKPCDLT